MEPQFWHDKWAQTDIGFHEADVNPNLVAHFAKVLSTAQARVFVPLCGKTRDIAWLLEQGHSVVGAELSMRAISDLFADLDMTPQITKHELMQKVSGPSIDIFVGDIFVLTPQDVGALDMVYDRAALVALPKDVRARYGAQVRVLSQTAPQLLLCFEYEQTAMAGPPFSVDAAEITRIYGDAYRVDALARKPILGRLKARLQASEIANQTAWQLRAKAPE